MVVNNENIVEILSLVIEKLEAIYRSKDPEKEEVIYCAGILTGVGKLLEEEKDGGKGEKIIVR